MRLHCDYVREFAKIAISITYLQIEVELFDFGGKNANTHDPEPGKRVSVNFSNKAKSRSSMPEIVRSDEFQFNICIQAVEYWLKYRIVSVENGVAHG